MDEPQLRFMQKEVARGIREIYERQTRQATNKLDSLRKSSRAEAEGRSLLDELRAPQVRVWSGAAGVYASLNYPMYIRFLDMKHLGNFRIFNSIIWRHLYGVTFNRIRFEYSAEVRQWLDNTLREIMNQRNTNFSK